MPSPEIANPAVHDNDETATRQVQHRKNLENYLRCFVLLVAVYALIINRALDDKKVYQLPEQPGPTDQPAFVKKEFTNNQSLSSKKGMQNSLPLMLYSGMTAAIFPGYFLWK